MTRAPLALLGPMARLVNGVLWGRQVALGFLVKVEGKARLVLQERRGPRENVVPRAPLAKMGFQGPWVFRDPPELLGLLEKKGTRGKWVPLVTRGAKAIREMRAHQDQQGYGVLRDTPAPRELMELRDAVDPQASLGRREMMESEGLWG